MTDKQLQVVNIEDYAMTPEKIQGQVNIIQKVMKQVMQLGEHYGTIPGCGPKPTLLKSGAEKLCATFRLAPSYQIQMTNLPDGHREYQVVTTLTHISSNLIVGQGVGSCTTMEGKYRFRNLERKCPDCGKEAIVKGKEQYGGGWLCWKKKDGCGAKFSDGDPKIEDQEAGKIDHDNPADYYNTVLKMSKKRSLVDAILTCTAASDLFTQDIEDMPEVLPPMPEPPPKQNGINSLQDKYVEPKNTVTEKTGFKPNGAKATAQQFNALYKLAERNGLTNRELDALGNWYKQGETLSAKEAGEMIQDLNGIIERYLNYLETIKER